MSLESEINELSRHLAAVTRSALLHGGVGLSYVAEIRMLDRVLAEFGRLRNGLEKGARVIEAGEKERRALVAQIAVLTRALQLSHDAWHAMRQHNAAARTAAENCLDEAERWEIEQAIAGEIVPGFVVLAPAQVLVLRQLAAAAVSSEFSEQMGEILDAGAIK